MELGRLPSRVASAFGNIRTTTSNQPPPSPAPFNPLEACSSRSTPGQLRLTLRNATSRKRKQDSSSVGPKLRRLVFMQYSEFPARYSQESKILETDMEIDASDTCTDIDRKLMRICHMASQLVDDPMADHFVHIEVRRQLVKAATIQKNVC